ncbi:MAG: GAF domain-containing protein [Bacillota bacterium]
MHDDKRDVLYLAAGSGLPPGFAERMKPLPRALHDEYVRQMGPVVVIPDLRATPDLPMVEPCFDHNLRTCVGVSMQRDGYLVGVLAVATIGEVRRFAADELALLQGLADQAAQALVNARLFSETRRRLKLVQALRNIDMAITGSLDLRVTFSVALDEITAQLDMDAGAILLLNLHTQTLEYAAWRGFRTRALDRIRLRLGEGYAGRAALERRTIYVPNLPEAGLESAQAPLLASEGFVRRSRKTAARGQLLARVWASEMLVQALTGEMPGGGPSCMRLTSRPQGMWKGPTTNHGVWGKLWGKLGRSPGPAPVCWGDKRPSWIAAPMAFQNTTCAPRLTSPTGNIRTGS